MAADTRPLSEIMDPRFTPDMNIAQRMHLCMTLVSYIQKYEQQIQELEGEIAVYKSEF